MPQLLPQEAAASPQHLPASQTAKGWAGVSRSRGRGSVRRRMLCSFVDVTSQGEVYGLRTLVWRQSTYEFSCACKCSWEYISSGLVLGGFLTLCPG